MNMKELMDYVKGLTSKKALDEFAMEYYGIKLDRRKKLDIMLTTFEKKAKDTVALKSLPFEEEGNVQEVKEIPDNSSDDTLVEVEETTEVEEETETEETTEVEEETETTEVEISPHYYTPKWAPCFTGPNGKYAPLHWQIVEAWLSGDRDTPDAKTIAHWITVDGSLLVRESRNSRFVLLDTI